MGETAKRVEEYRAFTADRMLPLQHLRARIWRAEVMTEEGAPPEQLQALLQEADALQREHRIAPGLHAMLLQRNLGEVLYRLGRLGEAEAAFREAARLGRELSYTPIRIFTALARLQLATGRIGELRALGESCLESNDVQREVTRLFGRMLVLIAELASGTGAAAFEQLTGHLSELRRLGAWEIVYRHLALLALTAVARQGSPEQGERMLHLAERGLEAAPSPSGTAQFRRDRGLSLLRRGRRLEARQSLEAALATFSVAANLPDAALTRRWLANLDLLEGVDGAASAMASAEEELTRLDLAVPPPIEGVAAQAEASPPPPPPAAGHAWAGAEQLVVPLQRLTTRGLGPPTLQRELAAVAAELFPGRAVVLEEVDSAGRATELEARGQRAAPALEWFDFRDGVGRRLRLGVETATAPAERAALQILVTTAALAFEVAGLRGLAASGAARSMPEPDSRVLPEFVAASPAMRSLKAELGRLSGSRGTIIVTGESGTGKEVVARAIHDLSRRAARPYVTFNSAATPRELFEGQLFGYRKGSFTGATGDHPGVIRAAEGGTLFLDEIGELPLELQPKLLRFLENGEILPLGERKPVQVDVRVIAATHRDLLKLVREGRFREDLYYRLQVIPVHIPPLRERGEDVLALARFFIRKLCPADAPMPVLTADAEEKLVAHAWPGNVRELRNVIERSLAFEPLPSLLTAELIRL